MKKVLLSLSMLAATVFAANAQQIVVWNSTTGTSGIAGIGNAYKFDGLSVDTATTAPHLIHASGTAGSNCGQSGTDACYYIGGFANGSFESPNVGKPWGITATDLSKYYLNIYLKSPNPGANLKIMFNNKDSVTTSGSTQVFLDQGHLVNLTTGYTTLTKLSIPLSEFSNCIGQYTNPDGVSFMTKEFAAGIYQIKITVNVGDNSSGVGPADVYFGDIFLSSSTTLGTQSAAANIASTKVYPNPATAGFTAEVNLNNAAATTVILSDMMGKQIATKSVENGSASFETAGLANGIYTVTYVVDGTPAKSELVVVK